VHYISDVEQARQVVAELMAEPVVGLDIETTGLDPLLDKIRLVQLACPSATYVIDAYHVPLDVLTPVLSDGPVKVAHNAKFDAGFLYEAPGGVMPEPLYDTMLADQVVRDCAYRRSLKDIAEDYLGESLDKEEQVSDWGSEQLTQAQIEYAATDAAVLLPLKQRLDERADSLGLSGVVELENRAVPAVVWMEKSGVGFDRERWGALETSAQERVETQRERLDELVEEYLPGAKDLLGDTTRKVNWNSAAQVLQLLKDLGLDAENTRQETLETLQGEHPLVMALLDHREASKKVSTYGNKWTENVHPVTGRVHADWKQIGASTGRMSCAKPNLQNLPRDPGYRACFRPAEGSVLIKADYEQIELRIAAEMAPDARMKRAFIEGKDLHATTATHLLGKKEVEDVTTDERQLAKAVNFGLIYGMGAKALADNARTSFGQEMDESEATDIRRRYFEAYPGIRNWQQLQGRKTETRTVLGRQRILDGDRYYTARLNSPIQGTGADGLKLALAKVWESRDDVDAFPVLAIHDEIVVEAPADKAREAEEWLVRCMREAMEEYLKEVPVMVDAEVRRTW
jgi:DNA polymerase-1